MRTPHGAVGPARATLAATRPDRIGAPRAVTLGLAARCLAAPCLAAPCLAVLCLALPIACTSVDRDGTTVEASGLTAQQLPDIPVPDGLLLQTGLNESHSFESGRLRHADLFYYGSLSVAEVRDYMIERMPLHGWRQVESPGESPTDAAPSAGTEPSTRPAGGEERAELEFERRPNRAHCSIWVDSGSVTRMHVAVRTPPND